MADRPHYRLVFEAPVSIMTGLGIAGLVDRTVVRGRDRLPYLPGSSVKGRLRYFARRLLLSGVAPAPYRIHAGDRPACKGVDSACTLCRLFGNGAIPSLIRVGDAHSREPWAGLFRQFLGQVPSATVRPDVEIRPGIAISRQRRVVLGDHLFFDEVVPELEFEGKLRLGVGVTADERQFLTAVGHAVDALGARKAAGRGRLKGGVEIRGVAS